MASITITRGIGYTGKMGRPSYVARIIGTTIRGKLERDFVRGTADDKAECFAARRKGKGTWDETVTIAEPGIYEVCQWGEATLALYVGRKADGVVVKAAAECPDADELARLIDLVGGASEAMALYVAARDAARLVGGPDAAKAVRFAASIEAGIAAEAE